MTCQAWRLRTSQVIQLTAHLSDLNYGEYTDIVSCIMCPASSTGARVDKTRRVGGYYINPTREEIRTNSAISFDTIIHLHVPLAPRLFLGATPSLSHCFRTRGSRLSRRRNSTSNDFAWVPRPSMKGPVFLSPEPVPLRRRLDVVPLHSPTCHVCAIVATEVRQMDRTCRPSVRPDTGAMNMHPLISSDGLL
jgi:hypothetical protein